MCIVICCLVIPIHCTRPGRVCPSATSVYASNNTKLQSFEKCAKHGSSFLGSRCMLSLSFHIPSRVSLLLVLVFSFFLSSFPPPADNVDGDLLPLVVRLKVAIGVASGLAYLHSVGVTHGNLRAGSVMLDKVSRGEGTSGEKHGAGPYEHSACSSSSITRPGLTQAAMRQFQDSQRVTAKIS